MASQNEFLPKINLESAPTLWAFMQSEAFIRIVIGPRGSGKSTGFCAEIMRLALNQRANDHGVIPFKAGIVRNTLPELKSTTMRTWTSVFPEDHCGPIKKSVPFEQRIKIPFVQGSQLSLDMIVEFFALDRPKDVKKLLSWEGSVLYFNEVREIELPIFNAATDSVGRYPSMAQGGVECSRPAVIADTNPPDEDHWLPGLENEAPSTFEFFHQPPAVYEITDWPYPDPPDEIINAAGTSWAVNPQAENLPNLPRNYYKDRLPGKRKDWISCYYAGKYVFVSDGKPVIPEYRDELMSVHELAVLEDQELVLGADIGGGTLAPAAVIAQRHPRGVWLIHAEICGKDIGLDRFSEAVKYLVADLFPGRQIVRGWGDPAGQTRDEIFETAAFTHLKARGLPMLPAPTNALKARIEAIAAPMGRLIEGKPGILIHKRCKTLRNGLAGKWRFRRLQIAGTERYSDQPDKNEYSHPCDALGYLLLGGGEYRQLQGRGQPKHGQITGQFQAKTDFSPW